MPITITGLLGIWSLLAVLLFYQASSNIVQNLSPQGCRMSWMSASYLLQAEFDTTWSPLAARYSLWLYREVGWDPVQQSGQRKDSLPVLFIPGNAGSSHQVRSIASSATRQYYSSPYIVSPAFERSQLKPLDFFAVEFNEDLSAFHGSTLESEIVYTSSAISYILSLYPSNTKIIVIGHSMGGIVATSLLPLGNISAIITMSTPHTLPPARFDSRIDTLYDKLQLTLYQDPTPIVSICGGATDMLIPSESCILPQTSNNSIFRRTVFTSALEGAWTGVGHREMVWCHQIRWRVARAALELGGAGTLPSRATLLDKWLRDGQSLPPNALKTEENYTLNISDVTLVETLAPGKNLLLRSPHISKTYLLPVKRDSTSSASQKFTVLVSRGSVSSVAPQNPLLLRVSILNCTTSSVSLHSALQCITLKPHTLKLIPSPSSGKVFPAPDEGSDESEGTVLYESHVPYIETEGQWIGVKVDGADGQGWITAGLNVDRPVLSAVSTLSLLMGKRVTINGPMNESLSTSFTFPNLLSNALVVYRVTLSPYLMPSCSDALMPPLLMHTSHATETHYFPLANLPNRRILLHTHLDAPFIQKMNHVPSLNFTIYSSGESGCSEEFSAFDISFDWYATLGRWASRYLHTLISWAAGIVSIVVFLAWRQEEQGVPMPSVQASLACYGRFLFRYILPGSLVFSVIPLSETLYLGNNGNLLLAPIAPLVLLIASGLVCVSWWILAGLLSMIGRTSSFLFGSRRENVSVPRSTVISLMTICILIFIFVPWQVAYLGCWLLHLYTCASSQRELASLIQRSRNVAVPLVQFSGQRENDETTDGRSNLERQTSGLQELKRDNVNHNLHLLLLMTWLLPLTAPVLAVWVRTLLTAGLTTPFDGDHNFLAVMPFLVLTDFASWTPGRLFERPRFETRLSLRWLFALIAISAFVFGSRRPYLVLDVARAVLWVIVVCRIGCRYFGRSLWLSAIPKR
ncbi:PGAP1-domain-containing protein [Phlegmacium glaucopus]|nr:PGAP1-domain-containing protein [Phlegmacium glaucopus]